MIRQIKKTEIQGLNNLPPLDWKFDYETFLRDFLNHDFFYAFTQIQNEKIVGTGNVLVKEKIAWLGNILVHKDYSLIF